MAPDVFGGGLLAPLSAASNRGRTDRSAEPPADTPIERGRVGARPLPFTCRR